LPVIGPSQPSLKPKDIESVTGKKLTFLQKLELKLLLKKLKKAKRQEGIDPKKENQALWSMILGLSSIVLLFIPLTIILAIPAAIAAIILGAISLKGNSSKKGIIGIIAGSVTLLTLIVAIAILAAIFSGGIG
jgi:hypothetical protein